MPFDYTSGNPDNLTGGTPARMQDIQGPFYDIRAWLNSSTGGGAAAGGYINAGAGPGVSVLDVGMLGQLRAGRQLANADFTALGLSVPLGLWNLGDLTDASGNGRALINKGAVPFGVGINGLSSTAAVFAGSTGQVLYIADTGVADPFRIKTGSWGCWARTAKRGSAQYLVSKYVTANQQVFGLGIAASPTTAFVEISASGTGVTENATGVSDVCDDRWHFLVVTYDGHLRLYVDGVLEAANFGGGGNQYLFPGSAPLNIGGAGSDGATSNAYPSYGRVDEAFVTADVLTDDQVRMLYCAKIAHTLGSAPTRVKLSVRRRRKGAALAVADFPASPVRLHNFTTGALTDEGTGGVALTSNPGTGSIVAVAGADGSVGNAMNFAGAHAGLSSTDAGLPAGTAALTFGAWFKTTTAAGNMIVSYGTVGSAERSIYIENGTFTFLDGVNKITGPVANEGQWHHGIMVIDNAAGDGVRAKMYMDGRLVGGNTALIGVTLAGANRFRVGARADGTLVFTGQIDGAFVYAGALTMEQVAALYAKGTQALAPSPKEPGTHVESMDAANVLAVFDTLNTQDQIDLGVAA